MDVGAANNKIASNESAAAKNSTPRKKPVWSDQANHGRYGFDSYSGLPANAINHHELKAGDSCPTCIECNQTGHLYESRPGSIICLIGNPLITGARYKVQELRCNLCGTTYKAEVPKNIIEQDKYHESVSSVIAINHYYLGLPFKRLETAQANQGVPLPDATQYDLMTKLEKVVSPIRDCFEKLSANSRQMSFDDTPGRILQEGKALGKKTIFSTAIISECGPYIIYLFNTSRYAAGRTVSQLLKQRESQTELQVMRDASSQNNLTDLDEIMLVRLVIAFCLVHGRRNFYRLLDISPTECGFVVECIAQVYKHEAFCKKQKLSPEKRLLYHKKRSQPVMDALRKWLQNQWQFHREEQNSALGNAIRYMLRHWRALTEFLRTPGCLIDNSHCEQMIKIFIRYRKASLFYRTLRGACIGDALMSVIHTAFRNNINAYDYLNALQVYAQAVSESPECWLPWNYQETLQGILAKAA